MFRWYNLFKKSGSPSCHTRYHRITFKYAFIKCTEGELKRSNTCTCSLQCRTLKIIPIYSSIDYILNVATIRNQPLGNYISWVFSIWITHKTLLRNFRNSTVIWKWQHCHMKMTTWEMQLTHFIIFLHCCPILSVYVAHYQTSRFLPEITLIHTSAPCSNT